MTPQAWLLLILVAGFAIAGLAIARPFGRASRYVALILGAYLALWAGVGHVWGYSNPWVIGIAVAAAAADLAALPWFLRVVDREDRGPRGSE